MPENSHKQVFFVGSHRLKVNEYKKEASEEEMLSLRYWTVKIGQMRDHK